MNKYRNKKLHIDGKVFDSQKEYNRYALLLCFEKSGFISGLKRQVKYELIGSHRKADGTIERKVTYIADFVYTTEEGKVVVEDVKGFRTKEYILKRKLMLDRYGIEIHEV